jgi:hypothetical protein
MFGLFMVHLVLGQMNNTLAITMYNSQLM